jgi:F420-0:gamma-glutamyl ligase-like protein
VTIGEAAGAAGMALVPNEGRDLTIEVDGVRWARLPIPTHLVTDADDIVAVVERYVPQHLQPGDYVFLSERIVATSQGRAYPIDSIRPSRLARFLVRFVHKSPTGLGIGTPWTMELAIREAGLLRIFLGSVAAVLTKPFGIRGMFYRVAGRNVASIDGPADYVIPPYNRYAKLGPVDPDGVARRIAERIGHPVVIVDANDLGVAILGRSSRDIPRRFAEQVFKGNPLGQTTEQTPIGIVRRVG